MTAHVAGQKKQAVAELSSRIAKGKVIGVVDIHGVPAPAFQTIRANLRDSAEIMMLKNSLMKLALQDVGKQIKGVETLTDVVDGQCAVVISSLNPFKLFRQLDATKTKMPAKGGEISPEDIVIKAGDTPFKPGPIVGDLQKAGLPAAIERGKVVIKKDKVLVKKGETISRDVALVLSKLEIYPMTVGLGLHAACENGIVYGKDVLAIDYDAYLSNVLQAAAGALNLAVFVSFPTTVSIRPMLSKAHMDALNLAVNASIANEETIKLMLSKANAQMLSLASKVSTEGLDDELKGILSAVPKPSEPKSDGGKKEEKKEDKKEEKVSEDEAAAGLGALFG
ncbi:MAG: 50S ribosomal protein L10 [Thermoplasmata archaeon]|nr:50S ribosomal protein L10 [Thermoplasmata archaeon]TFG67583.1 MAG: 50S ribosomal protein L10 [Methanomassiliicoccus sp.]